jgi:hypothetical protein
MTAIEVASLNSELRNSPKRFDKFPLFSLNVVILKALPLPPLVNLYFILASENGTFTSATFSVT